MEDQFYTHLISTEPLVVALNDLNMTEEERIHLTTIVEQTMHQTILDAVLSELSEEDKKLFLTHLATDDHEATWEFLTQRIEKIEEKIKKTANDLARELHEDIKETKQK